MKFVLHSDWEKKMNEWSQEKRPFLFIINYDCSLAILYELDKIPSGISCCLNEKYYGNQPLAPMQSIHFTKLPFAYSTYHKAFDDVIKQIKIGNSYLTNLTFPTSIQTNLNLADIYALAESKYKLYLEDHIVLFSPECFVKIEEDVIRSFPMKGTIDASIPNAEEEILNNVKEKAEHYTIVDLIRNDLSIVSRKVTVPRFRYIEKVHTLDKTLLQVSSEVRGMLHEKYKNNLGSLFKSLLPAGSISGAPKRKTCEIIAKAEIDERGFYTGIFGVYDGKNVDSAVNIRFIEQKDDDLFFRSGGGITALSDCESEYAELINKVYLPIDTDLYFVESICLKDNKIQNLHYHQLRMEESYQKHFDSPCLYRLEEVVRIPIELRNTLTKCRVVYSKTNLTVAYLPYDLRKIETLKCVYTTTHYAYKYLKRPVLDELFAKRGDADEIIIINNNEVSDAYYFNLVFEKDGIYYTPKNPLLKGTKRQCYLDAQKIKSVVVTVDQIHKYDRIHLINAMVDLGEIVLDVKNILV